MMKRWLLVAGILLIALYALPPDSFSQGPPFDPGPPPVPDPAIVHLMEVQARHEAAIIALPGVIGIGIGMSNGQLVFSVLVDKDAAMPLLPSDLEGIPVLARAISKIVPDDGGAGCNPCHNEQEPLPTPMGQSFSTENFCTACTLGFKACDPATGRRGYVINNHCNNDASGCPNGPVGLVHVERGRFDNGCSLAGLEQCGTTEKVVASSPLPV